MTDRLLIVDDDPETRSLLRDLVLAATEATVVEAQDGTEALLTLRQHAPDLILLDLDMPGLSGKDMLIALKSHGYSGPLIALASGEGQQSVLEAFRLGATDYVTKPLREAEVVAVLTRALETLGRSRRGDRLAADLQAAQAQVKTLAGQLDALAVVGDMVAQARDLKSLFDRVLDTAVDLTGAGYAMLLLREDRSGKVVLRAGKNLPLAMLDRLDEPVQDQLADLVLTSREALIVSGAALRRFAVAQDLHAAAYVPMVVQSKALGVLAVASTTEGAAFSEAHGRALKTLANLAGIALVNARLFALAARRAQEPAPAADGPVPLAERQKRQMQVLLVHLKQPLDAIEAELNRLVGGGEGPLAKNLGHRLAGVRHQVRQLQALVSKLSSGPE
jgi:two-component system response regulator AlgR